MNFAEGVEAEEFELDGIRYSSIRYMADKDTIHCQVVDATHDEAWSSFRRTHMYQKGLFSVKEDDLDHFSEPMVFTCDYDAEYEIQYGAPA